MFCRRAWQRVAPLTRRTFEPATRNAVPARKMSFGVPGGSFNTTYFVLCGGGLTAALVYAYKTINSDTERYENRLASMGSTAKAAPAAEVTEVIRESVSAPAGEAEVTKVIGESVSAPAGEAEVIGESVSAPTGEAEVTEVIGESVSAPAGEAEVTEVIGESEETRAEPEAAVEVVSEEAANEACGEAAAAAAAEEPAPPVAAEAGPESTAVPGEAVAMETPAETQTAERAGTAAVEGVAVPEAAA
eukprot:XP_011610712.1 PREDICTED: eukaryotic translation initiation factor 3 subunit B-like isoform X7 [Takifugu rubripes]